MQAYNYSDLSNKCITEEVTDAFQTGCIHNENFIKIKEAYPVKLYRPDYFVGIALGLLTIVSVVFSGLLLWLISFASQEASIITLLIILAAICYVILEVFVQKRSYYNAGVDNILMFMALLFITGTFFVADNTSWIIISGMITLVSVYLCARFADSFMAILAYGALYIFLFLIYIKFGNIAKATAPLLMMIISAIVYFLMKKFSAKTFVYRFSCEAVIFITLVTLYASVNYFVVKEVSNRMFDLHLSLHDPVPFGWLLWVFTILIPPAYIMYGIIRKNFLFMRTGLVLIAATIFTVKYYYDVLPAETEMLIGGVILIVLSYVLIKYLTIPKHGYTSANLYPSKKAIPDAETLIIAETFNKQPTPQATGGLYEGGSGGGGGATGEF